MPHRRDFLKSLALVGAAATLPTHALFAQDKNIKLPKPIGNGLSPIRYHEDIGRKKTPPRNITIPDVGEYKIIKGDFHIHTLFSDGQVMPRDRVLEAVDNGLDVIAITDHIEYRPNIGSVNLKLADKNDDHNIAYNLAKDEAEKNNLILVRGTEITKAARHFNALFLQDVNPIAAVVNDWQKMLAVATDQGGFIHWNHPGWVNRDANDPSGLKSGDPMRFFDEHEDLRKKGLLHGVEVFNYTTHYPIALDWCHERDLVPMVNSDVHESEWNLYGHQNPLRPMTLIFAKDRSYDSIREAFFSKRVVGWAANMVLGCSPWVEKLFRSCVEINRATLRNLSDIPCVIEAEGTTVVLPPQGTAEIVSSKKLTVHNWFVGTNKPLVVVFESG